MCIYVHYIYIAIILLSKRNNYQYICYVMKLRILVFGETLKAESDFN